MDHQEQELHFFSWGCTSSLVVVLPVEQLWSWLVVVLYYYSTSNHHNKMPLAFGCGTYQEGQVKNAAMIAGKNKKCLVVGKGTKCLGRSNMEQTTYLHSFLVLLLQ
jgi:hypothetical protein